MYAFVSAKPSYQAIKPLPRKAFRAAFCRVFVRDKFQEDRSRQLQKLSLGISA